MKTKSFQEYIEKRLTKEEIAEIDKQAQIEVDLIRSSGEAATMRDPKLQQIVEEILDEYSEALEQLEDN